MQEESKLTRANYQVPKGQERVVHYTIERVAYNNNGAKVSKPQLVKTGVKLFEQIKRDLELQGNTINILYHPEGRYNPEPEVSANLKEVVAEKDAEIARLKAMLEAKTKENGKEEKKERVLTPETPTENVEEKSEKPTNPEAEKVETPAEKVEAILAKAGKGKPKSK